MKSVKFQSGRLALAGHLYLPDPGRFSPPYTGVVVCHGFGSRKENQAPFDTFLVDNGVAVLGFDFRGHGASEGVLDDHTHDDVLAALDFLAAQPEVDSRRLAIRGSSMGAMFALHAASRDSRARAIALIAPAVPSFFVQGIQSSALVEWVAREQKDVRLDAASFSRAVSALDSRAQLAGMASGAVLFIQCKGDQVVPSTWTEELYAAASEPKRLYMIENGDHHFAQGDAGAHRATLEWFQQHV